MFSDTGPLDRVSKKKPHLTLKDEKKGVDGKITNLKRKKNSVKALLGSLIVKQAVESADMSQYYGFTVYFRF